MMSLRSSSVTFLAANFAGVCEATFDKVYNANFAPSKKCDQTQFGIAELAGVCEANFDEIYKSDQAGVCEANFDKVYNANFAEVLPTAKLQANRRRRLAQHSTAQHSTAQHSTAQHSGKYTHSLSNRVNYLTVLFFSPTVFYPLLPSVVLLSLTVFVSSQDKWPANAGFILSPPLRAG